MTPGMYYIHPKKGVSYTARITHGPDCARVSTDNPHCLTIRQFPESDPEYWFRGKCYTRDTLPVEAAPLAATAVG